MAKKLVALLVVLIASMATSTEAQFASLDLLDGLDFINKPLDWFLFDFIPRLIDQKPSNELPGRQIFKEYVMKDDSNDDAAHLTAVSLESLWLFLYFSFSENNF